MGVLPMRLDEPAVYLSYDGADDHDAGQQLVEHAAYEGANNIIGSATMP